MPQFSVSSVALYSYIRVIDKASHGITDENRHKNSYRVGILHTFQEDLLNKNLATVNDPSAYCKPRVVLTYKVIDLANRYCPILLSSYV